MKEKQHFTCLKIVAFFAGWFTQTNEPWVKREYRYYFMDHTVDYVVWEVKETRGNKIKITKNVIYVAHPFENAVEFTEKRNLVYNFKSWLARNNKGEIMAGLYFSLSNQGSDILTMTCTESNANKQRMKFNFSDILLKKVRPSLINDKNYPCILVVSMYFKIRPQFFWLEVILLYSFF